MFDLYCDTLIIVTTLQNYKFGSILIKFSPWQDYVSKKCSLNASMRRPSLIKYLSYSSHLLSVISWSSSQSMTKSRFGWKYNTWAFSEVYLHKLIRQSVNWRTPGYLLKYSLFCYCLTGIYFYFMLANMLSCALKTKC